MTARPATTIVGAGLGGALMAVYLARDGYPVEVYERRADLRSDGGEPQATSMNLGLSKRGMQALADVGVIDEVMPKTIPMRGRMIHGLDGRHLFQQYGRGDAQVIHAIKRTHLNVALLNAAERFPNVTVRFDQQCVDVDKQTGTACFRDARTGGHRSVAADMVIGADGLFSRVRQRMQRGERADYQQEFLAWGWKELTIPPGRDGSFQLEPHVFHLWPRGRCMMFAHPNLDGSFTCSLVLPFEGEHGFDAIDGGDRVSALFRALFPDTVPLMPRLAEEFARNPTLSLASIRTGTWYYRDRVVLIGDACHAVVPFYAQGMNAAFEDCAALSACLAQHPGDRQRAFAAYQAMRKRHTDALADMSKQNFFELCDKVRSPLLRTHKRLTFILSWLFPRVWMPLHAMVTHTTIPYADALERSRRQDRWSLLLCVAAAALLLLMAARAA